jgi:YVTN family beta-propeller protein
MGEVWLAYDLELGRQVAIKRLRPGGTGSAESTLVGRMIREARIAARLEHPNIIALYDIVYQDGQPYLVMQYVDGESLADRLLRTGPLAPSDAGRIIAQIASALDAAHCAGIVHRDVKPANILIDASGRARLADFGIARGVEDAALTTTGQMLGTVAYMAPEVARTGVATAASDVWSLGATLFAAVDGHPPFAHPGVSNPTILIVRAATEPAPPPEHAGPLAELIVHMLSSDPDHRPTAAMAARALASPAANAANTPTRKQRLADTENVGIKFPRHSTDPAPSAEPTRHRAPKPVSETPLQSAFVPAPADAEDVVTQHRVSPASAPIPPTAPGDQARGITLTVAHTRHRKQQPLASSPAGRGNRRGLMVGGTVAAVAIIATIVAAVVSSHGSAQPSVTRASDSLSSSPASPRSSASAPDPIVPVYLDHVVKTIHVSSGSTGVAITPDGTRVYIANSDSVSVIDTATARVTRTLKLGVSPVGVAINPDGSRAYIAADKFNTPGVVFVVDTDAEKISHTIHLTTGVKDLTVTPDGTRVYTTNFGGEGIVTVIDTRTNNVIDTIHVGNAADGIAISPTGGRAYVANYEDNTVSVINTSTNKVIQTIKVGTEPSDVAVSPDGTHAYVTNFAGSTVSVINTATNKLVSTISGVGSSPTEIAVAPDGEHAYVTDMNGKAVSVIDLGTNSAINAVVVGKSSWPLAITPDGKHAYVAGSLDGTVWVLGSQ